MTQENLSREVKDSEIKRVLGDDKLSPDQVSEAYTKKYEFVGTKKIRDKLKELAEDGKLKEEPMNDAQDVLYTKQS